MNKNISSEIFLVLANADLCIGLLRPDTWSVSMRIQHSQRATNTFILVLAVSALHTRLRKRISLKTFFCSYSYKSIKLKRAVLLASRTNTLFGNVTFLWKKCVKQNQRVCFDHCNTYLNVVWFLWLYSFHFSLVPEGKLCGQCHHSQPYALFYHRNPCT